MGFWSKLTRRAKGLIAPRDTTSTASSTEDLDPDLDSERGVTGVYSAPTPDPDTADTADLATPPVTAPFAISLVSASVTRLLLFGEARGPSEDEALVLLRDARQTAEEGMALDGLVRQGRLHGMPDRLLIAVASALVDRGDRAAARALLETTDDTASLVIRADLIADDGDLPGAVATIERVLLRDIDLPGARERRRNWRARLGLAEAEARVDPATMTVATARPRTPFEVVRELARGGAGVVYLAKDRELGRTVALKVYHQPARDRSQLLHEGRVATALEGPGIVRVFDIDPNDGWLVLEWASSGALRDVLRAPETASLLHPIDAWLPKVAHALARVHAAGWVHHDVKPANVLISPRAGQIPGTELPEPWLADFGSARRIGEPSPPGSLGYVSPERLGGRASDPRDDVYGLGRVIEDLLIAVGAHESTEAAARWKALAAVCVGPSDARPADGAEVAVLIERSSERPSKR